MKAPIDIPDDRIQLDDLGPATARVAGTAGAAALVVSLVLGFFDGEPFIRGYLVNYAFFVSLALGGLFFVLLQHATRAGWSVVVRRLAESVSTTFPLLAALSLPIIVPMLLDLDAIHKVYPWTDNEHVTHDDILRGKQAYLNGPFFLARLLAYFALWIVVANYFYKHSVEQDRTGDPNLTSQMQTRSAPAVILYALATTFFAFDLLMTLDPHWFSTIFGVYYFTGAAVGFFALLVIMMYLLQRAGRLAQSISIDHYHDVGKLVFAFVVFWAYIAFCQYMLIWYGNIPEETGWYVVRQQQPWLTVSLILLFGHFIIPFAALMSRIPKRQKGLLALAATWVLVMHWFDVFYLVMPRMSPGQQNVASLGTLD
ncbi:MAG: quinol:cytochrome C oxidoreductase, partial [Phycisphaerae bacterium]